ncbi:uracil phosphoribosyltransferase [Spirosomataceae bacterium TFI 002]|nr:uracil phosphoribosyltransferase [Spirosomataceae bacterium TFI 002]
MNILSQKNSILLNFLAEIRDESIQKDRMRFRKNIYRIGEIMAYEISQSMSFKNTKVKTVLGEKETSVLRNQPVIVSIMRAGLPLHEGFLDFFDQADNAFIGAYRGTRDEEDHFDIEMDYITSPDLRGRELIICDPMLATGKSLEIAYHALLRFGIPSKTHFATVIASKKGADFVSNRMPECKLWIADLDLDLNDKSYIVPGLGDAGDLAFGLKN